MKLYIDEILDESYLSKFKNLGIEQYCILYQNNVNSKHDSSVGTIDVDEIISRLESDTAGEGGCKFADASVVLLDFENPYTEFLQQGKAFTKTLSDGTILTFDTVRDSLISTINTLKARYPDKRWGYYGFPHPTEWLCCSGNIIGHDCSCPVRLDQSTDAQKEAASQFLASNFKSVTDCCDIFGPDLYQRDLKDNDVYGNDSIDIVKARFSTNLCKILDPLNVKEKICWISMFRYRELAMQRETIRGFELVSDDELFTETVDPWKTGGMDGFVVWTAMRYRFNQLTMPLSTDQNFADEQKGLRATFNNVFMGGYGGSETDDAYWTDELKKPIFKTIFTDQLYKFCEKIVKRVSFVDTTIAKPLFDEKFRVSYQFDGEVSVQDNANGEFKRAVGFGGTKRTFTWKRFITLEDSFNPNAGGMNPWCLKNWYKWGCRKFHFHNPFGKVALGKKQQLVYEVDQILTAKNGLTINGELQNTKMPWLVNDFVPVIKALTTGQQGTLDQATWDSWTTGPDAWFNPAEPIDLIVYIGSMADPAISDEAYKEYILRWADHFKRSPSGALTRLKSSVQPLIDANCKIGFDAVVSAAGPIPGKYIPAERQSEALQKGWWSFWNWLNKKVGKSRIYVESHPFRNNGMTNPYLGWNIIADDEWSYSPCCPVDPSGLIGPHATSEMGSVEFWRAIWQVSETKSPLISRTDPKGNTEPERYYFLRNDKSAVTLTSEYDPAFTEMRLEPPTCCAQGHNYYWYHIYDSIIAYHLTTQQDIRGEPNPKANTTKQGILVPCQLLQVLPESFSGDTRWHEQFGVKYPTSAEFVNYLASRISS